jgi:hypothetical protein
MLDGPMTIVAQTVPCGSAHIDAEISSTQAGDGAAIATTIHVCVPNTAIGVAYPDITECSM